MIATSPTDPAGPARPASPDRPVPGLPAPDGGAPRARRRLRSPATQAVPRSPAGVRPALPVLLGLLWAAVLLAATAAGTAATAGLLIPVGVVAALSAVRDEPAARSALPIHAGPGRQAVSSVVAVAVIPAVALPLAALVGPRTAVAVGGLLLIGIAAVVFATTRGGFPWRVLLAAFCPAIAAASVVLALRQGHSEAVTLLAAVCLYDMASFVMGTGAHGGLVGVVAGWLTVAALAVFVAAVMVPPYSGRSPWILLGLVAALAPIGVFICAVIARGRRLPALRRLDSLVLAGPGWVIAVGLLLHR